jgi:hypothetical protein
MYEELPVETEAYSVLGLSADWATDEEILKTKTECTRVRQDPTRSDMTGVPDVLTENDPVCIIQYKGRHSQLLRMWDNAYILRLFGAHRPER